MLTVLIAAKEVLVRIGISASIPWAALEAVLAGETGDSGEMASLYHQYHPDLLILDGGMPGMSEQLRRIREEGWRCEVILLAESQADAELAEAEGLDASEILVRPSLADGDLRAAVERACEALQPGVSQWKEERENRQNKAWKDFLFGKGCEKLPFRATGITVFRQFQEREGSLAQQRSLNELLLKKIGRPKAFTHLHQDGCEVMIWKDLPEKHLSRNTLEEVLQYLRDTLHVNVGCVMLPKAQQGVRLPAIARRAVSALKDPLLFDSPVIYLDENERYCHERLNSLRNEFAISWPFFRQCTDLTELKERLDCYPEALDEGMAGVLEKARPLLEKLEINLPRGEGGLEALTERICEKAEEKLRTEIPAFRPQIHSVMHTIIDSLPEHVSREELSKSVFYDSAYFSRLFKRETGMSYIEYLSEIRMMQARTMIGNTNSSYSEIARAVGFPNTSYFFKRFRAFFGMTPGEWREKVTAEKRNGANGPHIQTEIG